MSLNPREQARLVRIGDLALDAQDLSRMTYGAVPADDQGAGASWLRSVALAYADDREALLAEDEETRDAIIDRMTAQVSSAETWAVVTDLKLYRDAEDGTLDYGLWAEQLKRNPGPPDFRYQDVWAVPMNKITDALVRWLYETASALLAGLRIADIEMNSDQGEEDLDEEEGQDET